MSSLLTFEQLKNALASVLSDQVLMSDNMEALTLGDIQLADSPALICELATYLQAVLPELPDYAEYRQWFVTKTSGRGPVVSKAPAVVTLPYDPELSPLERRIAQTILDRKTQQQHEYALAQQQKIQDRIRTIVSTYRNDPRGYSDYLMATLSRHYPDSAARFFFEPHRFQISEAARQRHTFITGGTGSGKSESLKTLARHYLTKNTNTAVIVLDPHGPLSKDIAQFQEFDCDQGDDSRLVYIDSQLSHQHSVTINPFNVSDTSESGLETQCAQLIAAFEQILGGFTLNMQSLLPPVITTLLHRPHSDLTDLVRLLDDQRNNDLVYYAQQYLPYEEHRQFFKHQFQSPNYESTKDALRNRFQAFLNIPTIKRFTCGDNTLDLEAAIEQKKFILFNLSVAGASKAATTILGQFITALVQGYAMRRTLTHSTQHKKTNRTPIHLMADECQYFTSHTTAEILGESRKYGLYLTLATQRTDQVGEKILDAILGNVGVFLVGRNLGKTAKRMASELELEKDVLRALKPGQFYISSQSKLPIRINLPLIGDQYAMSKHELQQAMEQQLLTYYRLTHEKDTLENKAKDNNSQDNNDPQGLAFPLPNRDDT